MGFAMFNYFKLFGAIKLPELFLSFDKLVKENQSTKKDQHPQEV